MKSFKRIHSYLVIFFAAVLSGTFTAHANDEGSVGGPSGDEGSMGGPTKLENPLSGVNTLDEFLLKILEGVQLILTPVVILMIIFSGYKFLTAQGKPEKLKTAKQALLWALIGAGVIIGARLLALVVSETVTNLGVT